MMHRTISKLLVLILVLTSTLAGCGSEETTLNESATGGGSVIESAEEEPSLEEAEDLIDLSFETNEQTQVELASSDDAYMSILASPFYISTTFTSLVNDASYVELRHEQIDSIIMNSHKINELIPEIDALINENQNQLFGLFDSFIAEDLELPYIYEASNKYTQQIFLESVAQARIESIEFEGYETLADGWMSYQYAQLSLQRALYFMDRIEWIIGDGANLKIAAELYDDINLIEATLNFEEGIKSTDAEIGTHLADLAQAVVNVNDGFENLKQSDEYMSLAGMKFIQSMMPEVRQALSGLQPNDVLTAGEIEGFKAYFDVLEGYAYGAELLYLDESQYDLALEDSDWLAYVKGPELMWFESVSQISYADSNNQAAAQSAAYQKKAKDMLSKSKTVVKEKTGLFGSMWNAAKSAASSTLSGITTVAKKARTATGVVLDLTSAAAKLPMDVGMGVYYGLDSDDVLDTIDDNLKVVEENYEKGTSGSVVLSDAKSYIDAAEGMPGYIAKAAIGDNFISGAIDNTSKFITGVATGAVKGVFDLANPKSTNAELANAAFDVVTSYVSVTKVAKWFGKPFVKLGSAAAETTGSVVKSVAATAKSGLTTLASKASALLQKGPPLFSAAQKSALKEGLNNLGKALFNGSKDLGSKVVTLMAEKAGKISSSIKTMTSNAVSKLSETKLGNKIVSKLSNMGKTFKESMTEIFKDKIGKNVDEMAQNYAEGEGWNLMKEVNLSIEAIFGLQEDQSNREASIKLMEAKRSDKLPTRADAKQAEDKAKEDVKEEVKRIEAETESTSTSQTAPEASSEMTGQTAMDNETSNNETNYPSENQEPESTGAETSSDAEGGAEEEVSGNPADASYAGTYSGYASEIQFYKTEESEEIAFPIGAGSSNLNITLSDDGYVRLVMSVYGTGMFDFDIDVTSSEPATMSGSTLTFVFDESGARTTVSGNVSNSGYSGTIGVYSETNARIGHISFSTVKQ